MPVNAELRSLAVNIPTPPQALVRLSLLLGEEVVNLHEVSELVGSDMALAAAVLKAVNSSLYGWSGRVQTVHQALSYLGSREVAALAFEMGLRARFPSAPELEPLWQRASLRAWGMARLAPLWQADAWEAHSAGLFLECGKAVLMGHDAVRYTPLLRQHPSDHELAEAERRAFGVSHDALGAALCDTWGLRARVGATVRQHRHWRDPPPMPAEAATPSSLGALAVLVDSVLLLAPKAPWPPALQARVQGWAPALGAEPQAWLQALQGLQPELLARAHRGSG
jgi:HD-like signal output (HDOD) protein